MKTDKSKFFEAGDTDGTDVLTFRYLEIEKVHSTQTVNKPEFVAITHPVYVTLEKDVIMFYFHGLFGPEQEHVNQPFMRISLFGKRRLEQTLTEELLKVHNDSYDIDNDCYHYRNSEIVTYWKSYHHHLETICVDVKSSGFTISHERLFLDFIFDFEYSDLFKANCNYKEIYKLLQNETTYAAIFNKAEYMFYRCRCEQIIRDGYNKDKLSICRRDFLKAEEMWTDIIRKKEFESLCLTKNGWFESDVEDEYKNVLRYVNRSAILGYGKDHKISKALLSIDDHFHKMNDLFTENLSAIADNYNIKCPMNIEPLLCYSDLQKVLASDKFKESDQPVEKSNIWCKIYDLWEGIYDRWDVKYNPKKAINNQWNKINKKVEKIKKDHPFNYDIDILIKEARRERDFINKTVDWFLGRYDLIYAFCILWQRCKWFNCFTGKRVIIVISLATVFLILSLFFYGLCRYGEDQSRYLDFLTGAFIVIPLFGVGILIWLLGRKAVSLIVNRVLVVLIITWAGLVFSENIWNAIISKSIDRLHFILILLIHLILIVPPILFVYSQLKVIAPSIGHALKRTLCFFLYALICSVIIGINLMSFAYEYRWEYNLFKDQHLHISNQQTRSHNEDKLADTSEVLEHYHDFLGISFHFFPKFFLFGAILAVYLALFVDLGIRQRAVASESAIPD